jgi:sterol desaturase/sphingolipid hydroxylase (fatty acid hydroxylase superfamily)
MNNFRLSNVQRSVHSAALLGCGILVAAFVAYGLAAHSFGIDLQNIFAKAGSFLMSRLDVALTLLIAIPVVMVIETLWPAKPEQKRLSVSFGHDLAWFFVVKGFRITVLVWFISAMTLTYQAYFSFLTVQGVNEWPFAARFIAGVLLADALSWLHHFVRHKVRVLWHFHAIHHSQEHLNLFTDFRFHPFESIVGALFTTIPLLIFGLTVPAIVAFKVFTMLQAQIYHSNVRMNFGPLRYIFVTPQSHRIHHSFKNEHHDKNFGVIFSIWDRMFGTHYHGEDEYPDTGIADEHFPHERSFGVRALIRTMAGQLIYPFQAIYRDFRGKRRMS